MNECFTDPIFKISELKGAAEEREGVEGKVSYSVSSDLQIT